MLMCAFQKRAYFGIFCCLHPYLAYPYISIIDRTTDANLLLQGLETAIKHTETSGNARLEVKQ